MASSKTTSKPGSNSPRDLDDLLGGAPKRPPQPPGGTPPRSAAPISSEAQPAKEVPKAAQAVHKMTFNLTADNERGLSQLSYWRRGSKAVKTWILNQALVEYLARYPDSQRPIPAEDDE